MTRINTIDPQELTIPHLLAEIRELPRIFGNVLRAEQKGKTPSTVKIPAKFCLGAGHVTFFYDKLKWLENRFYSLVKEAEARGLKVNYKSLEGLPMPKNKQWWNDWTVTAESQRLIRERIAERIAANPSYYERFKKAG